MGQWNKEEHELLRLWKIAKQKPGEPGVKSQVHAKSSVKNWDKNPSDPETHTLNTKAPQALIGTAAATPNFLHLFT